METTTNKFEEEWFIKMNSDLPIVPREILNDITPENLQTIYKNGAMLLLYDFQAALRDAIQKEMKHNDEKIATNYSDMENIVYKKCLKLIETVTPKE